MKPIFRGSVSKGNLIMGEDYIDYLFTLEGQDVDLTIEKHRSSRSINQNAYYWSVCVRMIADETGYTTDETHEILKGKFLAVEARVGNEIIRYSRSTTGLKTNEFEDLMTQIREWASVTLNCLIPQPREVTY